MGAVDGVVHGEVGVRRGDGHRRGALERCLARDAQLLGLGGSYHHGNRRHADLVAAGGPGNLRGVAGPVAVIAAVGVGTGGAVGETARTVLGIVLRRAGEGHRGDVADGRADGEGRAFVDPVLLSVAERAGGTGGDGNAVFRHLVLTGAAACLTAKVGGGVEHHGRGESLAADQGQEGQHGCA